MSTDTKTGMRALQDALPTWIKTERPAGTDEVRDKIVGGVRVVNINTFPEETQDATRADVHFLKIGPTEDFPEKDELINLARSAMSEGVFADITAEELAGGPSYITLGGWLGSQQLALMFIGAVELAGIADAITPKLLGLDGPLADEMAGNGFVMLGPSTVWAND